MLGEHDTFEQQQTQQKTTPQANDDALKQHVLVNHFTNATGCNNEQALQLLTEGRWDFEVGHALCIHHTMRL